MDHGVEESEGSPAETTEVCFRAVSESSPGEAWQGVFRRGWPGWSAWLGRNRKTALPDREAGERALRRHMPEMLPLWARLLASVDAGDEAARFLTFWTPPRYLVTCSQAVLVDQDGPLLIRNYDLDPALNEATLLRSSWLGREVVGMVEGLAGLADGMNAAGLAVSLTFGGRPHFGRGFGIPIILRYLLEVCSDVAEAVEVLRAVPCHMSYNVTLLDRQGRHATVLLAHDRPSIVTEARSATNHQLGAAWPRYDRHTRSSERQAALAKVMRDAQLDGSALQSAFLTAPVHSRRYASGFGTVYTAAYRPGEGTVSLLWPGVTPWTKSFDSFDEEERSICYQDGQLPWEHGHGSLLPPSALTAREESGATARSCVDGPIGDSLPSC